MKMRARVTPPRARMKSRARSSAWIVGRNPEQPQRQVRFDRDAELAAVAVRELPAAVLALLAAEICFGRGARHAVERAPHVVQQQHLRGDRHVGLQLGPPVSGRILQLKERVDGAFDRDGDRKRFRRWAERRGIVRCRCAHGEIGPGRDAKDVAGCGVGRGDGVGGAGRRSRSVLGCACRRPP